MSIITLLVDFPNYSARKVRRLAKQLSLLEELQKAKELGPETGTLKGIASDLMEFNLLQAQREDQMNDDVSKAGLDITPDFSDTERWYGKDRNPTDLQDAIEQIEEMRTDWIRVAKSMGFDDYMDVDDIVERAKLANPNVARPPTENVVVTPVSEAMRAIDELRGDITFEQVKRAKGIVSGSAFTTTKEISE